MGASVEQAAHALGEAEFAFARVVYCAPLREVLERLPVSADERVDREFVEF